jgi:drug/metabolite transporter (DMT)-like permease
MNRSLGFPIMSRQLVAASLVFISAVCFSAKAVLVKIAYRYDVDSISLLTLRMLFALPFFLFVAWYSAQRRPGAYPKIKGKDWAWVILLGLAGYYVASILDFEGLRFISASMERLILFIYPTLVVLLSALFLRQKITPPQAAALGLTYLGIAVAFFENARMGYSGEFFKGAALIFLCALTFAVYLIGSGKLLPRIGTLKYTSYAMTSASLAIIIHHGVIYRWQLWHFPAEVYWLALLMGLLSTVLPSFLVSEGIRIIGSSNSAIIAGVGPISTIVLAYFFLGESLGPLQWVGTGMVIAGVLLISLKVEVK